MLSNYIKVTDKEIAEGTQEVNLGYSPHNIFIIPFQKKHMSAKSEPHKS